MLTEFGKASRRCRDEMGSNLKQMADYLEVPPSYLSAIEHGQKKVPRKIIEKTWEYFGATGPTMDEWVEYAQESPTHVKLDMTSADELERDVYMAVGRKFHLMPHERKKEIRDLLLKEGTDEA